MIVVVGIIREFSNWEAKFESRATTHFRHQKFSATFQNKNIQIVQNSKIPINFENSRISQWKMWKGWKVGIILKKRWRLNVLCPAATAELGGDPAWHGDLHPRHHPPRVGRPPRQLRDHQNPFGPGRNPAHAPRRPMRLWRMHDIQTRRFSQTFKVCIICPLHMTLHLHKLPNVNFWGTDLRS